MVGKVFQFIHRAFKRSITLFYYLSNVRSYKYLDFKATVYLSVRVNGKQYISIARNSSIQRYGWLLAAKIDEYDPQIVIEPNCAIGDFSHITAVRKVHIEESVLIANHVYISDNLHGFSDIHIPVIDQQITFKRVVIIKKGAWLGENVCIIGASVGRNSVIGANSVVTEDIPDYCVAVGVPARVIKRFDFASKQWVSI